MPVYAGVADNRTVMIDIRNRIKKLHKDKSGAAMIVVVCVLMITMIICLTLIVGAYQMLASVNDEGGDVSGYYQAMSFSEVLKNSITGTDLAVSDIAPGLGMEAYILAFAGADNYKDPNTGLEIDGGPSTELKVDNMPASMGTYGNLHVILKKKKMGTGKCRLLVTVMTMSEGRDMATVTSGYDVTLHEDANGNKTADVAFRMYYDMNR